MLINKAYKLQLDPNKAQISLLAQHAGTARFTYNWGLAQKMEAYKLPGKSPSAIDLHKKLNTLKKDTYPWMYDVSKCAPQEALRNLDTAYKNFFRNVKAGKAHGFPKFKKKGIKDSFKLTGSIHVDGNHVQLPILGNLRLHETPEIKGRILGASVSRDVHKWFVSLSVEEELMFTNTSTEVVGIDLGLKTFATLSDGTTFENPKVLKAYDKKLKRAQRNLARKQLKSKNRIKSRLILGKIHQRIRNLRSDFLHKLTTFLAKTKLGIVIEDLQVSNMLKNHKLARSISDVNWAEFRRMLTSKCSWYGCDLQVADKWFASSKLCSSCGHKHEKLTLTDRVFVCPSCGFTCDRDLNASYNLRSKFVPRVLGDFKPVEKVRPKITSMKQEVLTVKATLCKFLQD